MTTPPDTGKNLKPAGWQLHDLIDLEYFLQNGAHTEVNEDVRPPVPADRDLYLSHLRHLWDESGPPPRRLLIKGWLDARREEKDGPLPGDIFKEVRHIAFIAAALLGIASGIGLALSLLNYHGTQPLNVSIYLGAAVFSQILLLLSLAILFSLKTATGSLVRSSILAGLLGRILAGAALKARQHALKRMDRRRREAIASAAGLLRGRKQIYGSLFFWPVFVLVQCFAFCFNLGLLGATLIRLAGTDVAFGWQSTFQVSSRVVFRIVETIALPWHGIVPPALAHPSLAQIEGSRMILKEGIYHLATSNLVSWWPFLCLSVFFYGLLPRLLLLISGITVQNRLLARLRFDHGDCDALVRRMITPVVNTAGRPLPASGLLEPFPGEATPTAEKAAPAPSSADTRLVALVPEEIFEACRGLEALLPQGLGVQVTDWIRMGTDFAWNRPVLDSLKAAQANTRPGGIVVFQEAWQPPIQETLLFLKQLRRKVGDTDRILLGLVGKPSPETTFAPVREEDWRIWKRKVESLGDPYLRAERVLIHDR